MGSNPTPDIISPQDRARLLDTWQGRATDYPRDTTLAALFRDRVAAQPGTTALIADGETISYRDLDLMAGAIAQRLVRRGVQPGDTVGIALERSIPMVAAMLATLQTGAAYVPLDPANPPDRLADIAGDARLRCTVSLDAIAARLGFGDALTLDDLSATEIAAAPPLPAVPQDPLSLAYVPYTSGSTGKPKGVMGTHRATINRFVWMWRSFPFTQDEVMCQKTAISFVDSVWEIFGPLLAGVPQVIIDNRTLRDPGAFLACLGEHGVTRLLVVPSLLKTIVATRLDLATAVPSLTMLFTSGERISRELAEQFRALSPHVTLINLYGSSEVAADVTCEVVGDPDVGDVPIGRPIDNTRIYLLDEAGALVAPGNLGEIHVGGDGLAAGYLHRPDLTAERFLPDPFVSSPGARMFATGDMAQHLPDGRLMFRGRRDHQVKVRGARVELGEVEQALQSLPDVAEAVVLARTGDDGETVLIAHVVGRQGATPVPREMRGALGRRLPDYMVPGRIIVQDSMPLNPNGKTDRPALARMLLDPVDAGSQHDITGTATEAGVIGIWASVLKATGIGPDSDFFDLGGHSLSAVTLVARVRQSFGVDLPIATLLENPTPRQFAHKIDTAVRADIPDSVFMGAQAGTDWDTSVTIHQGPGSGALPLFIVGGVGGNVNNLFELGQRIGRHRPLIGLQTRGILGHAMHDSIEATAADHIVNIRKRQAHGPYLLAGYSGGTFAAFEMARQLHAAGETVAFLGLLDSVAPKFPLHFPSTTAQRLRYNLASIRRHGPRPAVTNVLRLLGNTMRSALAKRLGGHRLPRNFLYARMADHWHEMSRRYQPQPYEGDACLFLTEADSEGFRVMQWRRADPLYGWPAMISGRLNVYRQAADHITMVSGPHAVELSQNIETEIRQALLSTL